MIIKFEDITDQQCADIIAHFVERKRADKIVVHTEKYDIEITKKSKDDEDVITDYDYCTSACALIASVI